MKPIRIKALREITTHAECVDNMIRLMTPRQRKRLKQQIGRLTSSNCSWLLWDQRTAVLEIILMHTPSEWPCDPKGAKAEKKASQS